MQPVPQTIGERNDASGVRPLWADLKDSSCEDFLDSQPALPSLPLHTESYIETPEPSFDHPDGSVLCNLHAATALNSRQPVSVAVAAVEADQRIARQGSAAWQPSAAAAKFMPEASSSVRHRFRRKRRVSSNRIGARGTNLESKRPRQEEPLRDPSGQRHINGIEDLGALQPNLSAIGTETCTDEDWQRRHEKRTNVVQSIKTTLEYETMRGLRDQGQLGGAAPSTPDAHDRMISKRKWESLVMHWRNDLRQYTRSQAGSAP